MNSPLRTLLSLSAALTAVAMFSLPALAQDVRREDMVGFQAQAAGAKKDAKPVTPPDQAAKSAMTQASEGTKLQQFRALSKMYNLNIGA